uniref:Uncharacterized protein n=1 Tax=Timema cristinae TaxID=61476 RepID=A0A7R9DIC3_TIMCR|nr:unnamed protein product [Timema cristinae]
MLYKTSETQGLMLYWVKHRTSLEIEEKRAKKRKRLTLKESEDTSAALVAVTNVSEYLDETAIRRMVLPKTKAVYEKNSGDIKIVGNVLSCVEKTLDRLDKSQIIDEVLPLLWDVRLQDPEITIRVVKYHPVSIQLIRPPRAEMCFSTSSAHVVIKLNLRQSFLIYTSTIPCVCACACACLRP